MKIGKKMQDAINRQINVELYSSYLYNAMGAYFDSLNLVGFANWLKVQAEEEREHAMRFYGHVVERQGRVIFDEIKVPPSEWKSPLNAFEEVYKHELHVTELINELVGIANDEKDTAALFALQWFVNEQIEEEANSDAIVQKLIMVKDSKSGLLYLDHEVGKRKKE